MVLETFRQALQNVWSNKLRTFLTMLGIIIGVMAVIVIVGLGNGMTRSMRDSFSAMGTNTLSIQIWGYGSRTATVDDLYDLVKKNPELLSSISPQLDFSDNTPKVGTTTYRYSEMYGVDENYIEMKGYTLAKGRNIQYMDIADNKQICVIGDYINRTAYGGNAVGQTIKLGPYKFRIVGVLKAKISNPDQQEGSDDDSVYLPYTTAMRLSNESSPDSYSAIMVDEGQANEAKAAVEQGLYDIFKSDNAYYVYSASEWLEEMNKMINMVIVILTGIASISLLVGGIGIMNIMLVTVTERDINEMILLMLEKHRRVVDAAGAVSLAALEHLNLRSRKFAEAKGPHVVVPILSGGNEDTVSISAVIQKGMIARGRIMNFEVELPDTPGQLVKVATILAEQRANVIALDHDQFKASSHYTDSVSLGVTVETNGPEHIDRILDAMRAAGFQPKRIY